ncbi:MurR/RpiR family transcriptional regulator [Suicoccus acidiformans]|nr:MurR/RpiR family transcriptional regulator [Suicoccus acidiformans]
MHLLYQRLITVGDVNALDSIEFTIASTMIKYLNNLPSLSIDQLAELCHVSKSSLSKFVRSIGFKDYSEFREAAIEQNEPDRYKSGYPTQNITDGIMEYGADGYLKILAIDIKNLFGSEELTDKISHLVDDIYHHDDIAAFGEIYSETAAMNFQYKMSYYRKFVYTSMDTKRQSEYMDRVNENCLIIIFSNSGKYLQNVSERFLTSSKMTRVLITSNPTPPNAEAMDYMLEINYSSLVQNHPILYQLLIERIAVVYQERYGLPNDI